MISHLFTKQKTTYNGNYRSVVVDNDDPLKLGRIKVRVYGVMQSSNIPTASLPWAVPMMPISSGAASQSGSFYVPIVGSEVYVFFEEGNYMSPVYFGEAQNGVKGLPAFKDTDYPNSLGLRMPDGMQSFFNIFQHYFKAEHPIGSNITVDNNGDVSVVIKRDSLATIQRDWTATIARNLWFSVVNESSITDLHDERLVPPGTGPIPTFLTTAPSGWLFMYGQTMGLSSGNVQGQKYETLFNILKSSYPNTGSESFSTGDTVIIPDLRGRIPVGKDNIGGSSAGILTSLYTPTKDTIGGILGEETHQLTIPELPRHKHDTIYQNNSNGGQNGPAQTQSDPRKNTYASEYTGEDVPHNNMQPGVIVNMMIKY